MPDLNNPVLHISSVDIPTLTLDDIEEILGTGEGDGIQNLVQPAQPEREVQDYDKNHTDQKADDNT